MIEEYLENGVDNAKQDACYPESVGRLVHPLCRIRLEGDKSDSICLNMTRMVN